MIESDSPIYQTLLGTLFTWGMTAAGAGLVVVISGTQVWSIILIQAIHLNYCTAKYLSGFANAH